MIELISKLIKLIKSNLGKFFVSLLAAIIFVFLLFPFDDLGDLVSTQVAQLTHNSLYVQFDRLRMSLFPQPGVAMEQVFVESIHTPGISAQEITITPSISGLIQQRPYGHIAAHGFLKGNVDLKLNKGNRSDNGVERQKLEINAQKVSLTDIRELANLPVMLKGRVDLQTTALADLSFQEQPEVDVNLTISQFELPPASINTPMGPLTLPDLKLASVELKGRLSAGKFIIETGTIGKPTDDLHGTISGNIGLNLNNQGGSISPQVGAYTLEVNLKAKQSFQERATLFLTFIDAYKTPMAGGAQYKFKVMANAPGLPPNIIAVH